MGRRSAVVEQLQQQLSNRRRQLTALEQQLRDRPQFPCASWHYLPGPYSGLDAVHQCRYVETHPTQRMLYQQIEMINGREQL